MPVHAIFHGGASDLLASLEDHIKSFPPSDHLGLRLGKLGPLGRSWKRGLELLICKSRKNLTYPLP